MISNRIDPKWNLIDHKRYVFNKWTTMTWFFYIFLLSWKILSSSTRYSSSAWPLPLLNLFIEGSLGLQEGSEDWAVCQRLTQSVVPSLQTELNWALLGLLFPFTMCYCTRVTRYMSYPCLSWAPALTELILSAQSLNTNLGLLQLSSNLCSIQPKLVLSSRRAMALWALASLVTCVDQSNKILPYHLMTEREINYIAYFAGSKLWIR
jgi:hypothetical protein